MDNTGDPDLYIVLRPRYNAINTIITQLEKSYRWKLLFKLPLKGTTCLFDYCTIIESFRLCCIQAACVVRCKDKILNLNLSLFIFFFFFLRPNIYPNSFVWLLSKFHSSSNFSSAFLYKSNTFKILARVAFFHISSYKFNFCKQWIHFLLRITPRLFFFFLHNVLSSNQISNSKKKNPKKNTTREFQRCLLNLQHAYCALYWLVYPAITPWSLN